VKPLRIAVSAWQVGRVDGVAGFAARLGAAVAEARANGAELLLLPEYAAMEAAVQPEAPDIAAELETACRQACSLSNVMRDIAQRHGVWLVPGSVPVCLGAAIYNRAPLIAPDGRFAFQDKRLMTRFEAEQWGVVGGDWPGVFETPWGRIGLAICFDAEFPTLVHAQVEAGAWLVLVPACTDTAHGAERVRLAARARAMENQCFTAVSPTVGEAPWLGTLDVNTGRAGIYGPVDRGFAEDGVVAEGEYGAPGWLYADLDPARLARVREDGAVRNERSWPGAVPPARLLEFA
jgi:predicted amidohydrolase